MKQLFLFLLLVAPRLLFAQEDAYHAGLKTTLQTKYGLTGGNWVFATDEVVNANSTTGGGGTRSGTSVTGLPFTRAVRLAIATRPANPWNAGLSRNTVAALKKGDRVLLVFWARYIAGTAAKGMGAFTFENNVNFNKDLSFEYRFGTDWKQYILPFEISQDQPAAGAKFSV